MKQRFGRRVPGLVRALADFGAVLSQVGGELFQSSWVVADLPAAQAAMQAAFGTAALGLEAWGRTKAAAK